MSQRADKVAVTRDVKQSISCLLNADTSLNLQNHSEEQPRILQFPGQQMKKQTQIFSWRLKTYLPIIKPADYSINPTGKSLLSSQTLLYHPYTHQNPKNCLDVPGKANVSRLSKNSPSKKELGELRVQMETMRCRLSEIDLLPLSQIMYLLKEMMIGYDALLDIFGIFTPTERMVAVSPTYQWKVWINEDYYENAKPETNLPAGERDFIYKLLSIAEKHCQGTTMSKIFFNEAKQYTYNTDCSFIKMLEKIKDFTKTNKIFQVNKVTLPNDKSDKFYNPESPLLNTGPTGPDSSFKRGQMLPQGKMKIDKKYSYQTQVTSGLNRGHNNVSQIIGKSSIQQVHSQKQFNKMSLFYYPQPSIGSFPSNVANYSRHDNSDRQGWNDSLGKEIDSFKQNKTIDQAGSPTKHCNTFRSPDLFKQPKSPKHLERKSSTFALLSKSRHELKLLVNPKGRQHNKLQAPPVQKSKSKQRKYSEQLFKAKSVDVLAARMKKISGSSIYEQDPELKNKGVNVIKMKPQDVPGKGSPMKLDNPSSKTKEKSSTLKGANSSTPNHSSNSTNQMQHSQDHHKKGTSYHYLKANDLNTGKIRNNQSSHYGMGGYPQEQKRDKNMTISYEFRNRNQAQSKSSASSKNQEQSGNNWAKKISGLFSDDASIKHLKGSVKFKTAQEERFEKEYLKDVKLQMLQKFGRPVRHSIAEDDEDDFQNCPKNPYKSMQLIEEVMDEGKSYMEKDQSQHEEEEPVFTRGRTRTVQVGRFNEEPEPSRKPIKQRECFSFEESQHSEPDQEAFNFESQNFVINRR